MRQTAIAGSGRTALTDRSHVYRTFHDKEISLSDLFTDVDLADDGLLITRKGSEDGLTQVAAGLATWKNMQNRT